MLGVWEEKNAFEIDMKSGSDLKDGVCDLQI